MFSLSYNSFLFLGDCIVKGFRLWLPGQRDVEGEGFLHQGEGYTEWGGGTRVGEMQDLGNRSLDACNDAWEMDVFYTADLINLSSIDQSNVLPSDHSIYQ